ncbi:MAG: hypothetical protein JO263_00075 [Candidatus Eremiobacteraeota bacterium]|nr:hypothetical protein [Candidatus Eremiobacteraeota bacterium]
MKRYGLLVAPLLAALLTSAAAAATLDPASMADGTYTVKVEQVIDAKHVKVALDTGGEATLTAGRPTVNFSNVRVQDQLKLSIIKGEVVVYLDLTSH